MFANTSYGTTIDALQVALNATTLRTEVISNNMANVNTPNFKRQEVSFEGALQDALQGGGGLGARRSSPRHLQFSGVHDRMADVAPLVHTVQDTTMRTDGNNVDVDREMAGFTKNVVLYNALTTRVGDMLKNLNDVIADAGKR